MEVLCIPPKHSVQQVWHRQLPLMFCTSQTQLYLPSTRPEETGAPPPTFWHKHCTVPAASGAIYPFLVIQWITYPDLMHAITLFWSHALSQLPEMPDHPSSLTTIHQNRKTLLLHRWGCHFILATMLWLDTTIYRRQLPFC